MCVCRGGGSPWTYLLYDKIYFHTIWIISSIVQYYTVIMHVKFKTRCLSKQLVHKLHNVITVLNDRKRLLIIIITVWFKTETKIQGELLTSVSLQTTQTHVTSQYLNVQFERMLVPDDLIFIQLLYPQANT